MHFETTPKNSYSFTTIQMFELTGYYSDYTIYLKDIDNNKYKVCFEFGDYTQNMTQKLFEFDLELDNSCKYLGLFRTDNVQQSRVLEMLQSLVKEEDIGMRIDTTLDTEPLYFCDGTNKNLIITDKMVIRGIEDFNTQLQFGDSKILTK